ncbi:MAG: RnfABCDGE type electron transport complex subunit D [Peptoniphilaceae bacterium]|nr:RnfABCDGE type electron transport complex subunit D [Peptoniphilaceae bacterium]MDD7383331.1 RnfABCDGE type electron transport complex subunit D [Peptoniphilaceae bacterium]MDY3738298.1 RnfABCDGE type electron transport complex subunit D [Peptoniphilaceae bacterium]
MEKQLLVTSTPHIKSKNTVTSEMLKVIIALIPTGLCGIWFFGIRALILILTSVFSCVVFEFICNKIMKRKSTIGDLSAVVTGMLLAYNVTVTIPIWQLVCGAFFAIIVCKMLFGGLGQNIINPALGARAFLLASWPASMSNFVLPSSDAFTTSATTSATVLSGGSVPSLTDMFIGNMGGTIGEVSTLAILIGAAFLVFTKVISLRIPITYILTTAILLSIFNKSISIIPVQLLSGGIMLGAFFMATDYTTSPVTPLGQIIFALGCGILTAIIRTFGGYPEGVSYSILLMNICVPLIEKFTVPKVFGHVKKGAENE